MADDAETPKSRTVARQAHWIEWATGFFSTVVVAAMIAWIGYHAFTSTDGTPDLAVRIIDRTRVEGGYKVSFTIENKGTRTAAAVPVKGEIIDGERVIETREIVFDYVPAQSRASGALVFTTDPAKRTLEIKASGYVDP